MKLFRNWLNKKDDEKRFKDISNRCSYWPLRAQLSAQKNEIVLTLILASTTRSGYTSSIGQMNKIQIVQRGRRIPSCTLECCPFFLSIITIKQTISCDCRKPRPEHRTILEMQNNPKVKIIKRLADHSIRDSTADKLAEVQTHISWWPMKTIENI